MAFGPKPEDLTGVTINRIEFLSFSHRGNGPKGKRFWHCRCHCREEFVATASNVRSGHTRSCGCALKERKNHLTHGKRRTLEYNTWAKMIQRCTNPNDPKYPDYGGRGITVCQRWRESFADFLADMGERPAPGHSIHRIDNDGPYAPGNCCWADAKIQAGNRRPLRVSRTGRRLR